MKTEIGTQLSNLLRFYWKCYKRKKDKKKKKKKGKGKKGKGKKKLDSSKTMSLTQGASPTRSASLYTPAKGTAGKASATGSGAKSGAKGSVDKQATFSKPKVTAQDHEGTLDLTSGDNENAFSYSAQEMMRRETIQPTHDMDGIVEDEKEEGNDDDDLEREIKEENEEDEDETASKTNLVRADDANQNQAQSNKELFKLHEVSILDLDKEGSLLNDDDSNYQNGMNSRNKLEGDLGEGKDTQNSQILLVNQPSEIDDL